MPRADQMKGFRKRLNVARRGLGLSVEAAAEAADIQYWEWRSIEYTRKTPATVPVLRRMLEAVELPADDVLREEGLL